ncbi:hypothetical protein FRC17_004763 [Serendipita sp. 399]|nr:hypothetical protein FRC17_004763 [Serendipita sp. 399]
MSTIHSEKKEQPSSHGGSIDNSAENRDDAIIVEHREELGTGTAEASAKVWSRYSLWALYISIGLAAYVYSLDYTTTYFYTPFATSSFTVHSLLSSIEVVSQIILAVGKPVVAHIADLKSRPFAFIIVITFYVVGYILIASSHGVSQYAAGKVFQSAGQTGLQLLSQVIVADITPLKWRGFVTACLSGPFIINSFVGSKIASSITTHDPHRGWRWGYGMFCILVPVSLAPILAVLVWGENKAKKLGLVKRIKPTDEETVSRGNQVKKILNFAIEMDLLGLILFGLGWALLLIPLTLSAGAKGGWQNPSIIAMIVLGPLIIIAFGIYEVYWARFPIFPGHFLRNRALMATSFIGFFDFISFYLTALYLTSFLYVVKTPEWTLEEQNYFTMTQSVGLTIFAIVGGVIMRWTRRFKLMLLIGLAIRCLGVGIMIRSRGAHGSDAELVMSQVLQALGGGLVSISEFTAAQASVVHKHVAMAIAFNLLITEVGGAIGSAIAGSIWSHLMPRYLRQYLPGTSDEQRSILFGSIVMIVALPPQDPIRTGVIQAYSQVMKVLIIASLAIGLIPLLLAAIIPNWRLGDAQNAIDGLDITGRKFLRLVGAPAQHHNISGPTNKWELDAFAARHTRGEPTQSRPQRQHESREEPAASCLGRASLASAASSTPLASKHSSLGPLPIFPRPPTHTISRHSSGSNPSVQDRPIEIGDSPEVVIDHNVNTERGHIEREDSSQTIRPSSFKPRSTLASLFQTATRKALRRDEFRKDSYQKEPPQEQPVVSQSVPSTPLRRRFLGLKNVYEGLRSPRSTPAPPELIPPLPSNPLISTPQSMKGRETPTMPIPILKRKRSSLPNPPLQPLAGYHAPEEAEGAMYGSVADQSHIYSHSHSQSQQPSSAATMSNLYHMRRSRSDSKHGKRSHSPGQTTSIRVPGPPPQHHPHPHPFFSCETPLSQGLLSLPSFDFERPATRPSTPRHSQDYLPLPEKNRRYKTKTEDVGLDEIKSVIAAGTEARRERRAPSRERLRVIGGLHRQHLPDVTDGDDQLSPDPVQDPATFGPLIPNHSLARVRSHLSHGMMSFESAAGTPYGSLIDLPLTPPPSKPRRNSQNPPPLPRKSHHRHLSSSATAVAPHPPPPPPLPSDDNWTNEDQKSFKEREFGYFRSSGTPKLFAGSLPKREQRSAVSGNSFERHHARGSSSATHVAPISYQIDANDGYDPVNSPSYRLPQHQHTHSRSLSGATMQNPYLTPAQTPTGLGINLYPEVTTPTRQDRFHDLRDAMKFSIGESRFLLFEKAMRRYNEQKIPLQGPGGLFDRVQRLLNDAMDDGLPPQTARKYYQTFQLLVMEVR